MSKYNKPRIKRPLASSSPNESKKPRISKSYIINSTSNFSEHENGVTSIEIIGERKSIDGEVDSTLHRNELVKELEEINSKNFDPKMAFSYKFLDHVSFFVNDSQNKVNFNLLGEALDAATRIYTSRVDIVQKQIQKIATRLSIADEKKKKEIKTKQRNKKHVKHFDDYAGKNLVKNISNINGKISKTLNVDPLYKSLSTAYDVTNISVLINRQLLIKPSGGFAFNSSDKLSFSDYEFDKFSSNKQSFPYPLQKESDLFTVHPAFRDFDFKDRSIDMEHIVDTYRSRQNLLSQENDGKLDRTSVEQLYEFDNNPNAISKNRNSVTTENSAEADFDNEEDTEKFDEYVGLDMNDDNEGLTMREIFEELVNESESSPDKNFRENERSSMRQSFDRSKSRLFDQAIFMSKIFNQNNFFQKSFLKRIHYKRFPHDFPKTLFIEEERERQQEAIAIKKALRKTKIKFEPLKLSIVNDLKPSNYLSKKLLSFKSLKNYVSKSDHFRIRQKSGFSNYDLFRSFWNPKVIYKSEYFNHDEDAQERTIDEEIPGQIENAEEDLIENNPNFEDDNQHLDDVSPDLHDEEMDNTSNHENSVSQQQTIPEEITQTSRTMNHVNDFGEDIDPFGLEEQNRDLFPYQLDNNEPVPLEDRFLEYSTKMRKINIKKLKKIMFSIVEQFSWKHSKLQEYYKENRKYPESECLSFYKLIYHIIYESDVDEQTLDDLTIPIFFVATLHLCNDKKLLLTKFEDNSGDFYITMLE